MDRVPLEVIEIVEAVSPRSALSDERIAVFVTLVADGGLDAVPPLRVVADGTRMVLFDGRHRYEALVTLGEEQALVERVALPAGREIADFGYEQALLASAVSALPLSRGEMRRASERLLREHPEYADREIARLSGLSHQTVGRMRQRSSGPLDEADDIGTGYLATVTADEIAGRLARSLARIWEARGLGDLLLGDRTGKRLAAALRRTHGEDALAWANRLSGWASVAATELRKGAS